MPTFPHTPSTMTADRWLIHRRLAEDSVQRLAIVTAQPQHILLFGADNDISRSLLAERHPKAQFSEYDHRADFLEAAAQTRQTGWWQRWRGQTVAQTCQSAAAPLPVACADWLWSNLGIPADANLPTLAAHWANALKTDGLLFFTHFGRDTLNHVLSLLAEAGLPATLPFPDMHDLGDILFHNGFYDPVIDTTTLQLAYHNTAAFWQDMDTFGLWSAIDCNNKAAAQACIDEALNTGHLKHLSLQIVFGHAVRRPVLAAGEHPIHFHR